MTCLQSLAPNSVCGVNSLCGLTSTILCISDSTMIWRSSRLPGGFSASCTMLCAHTSSISSQLISVSLLADLNTGVACSNDEKTLAPRRASTSGLSSRNHVSPMRKRLYRPSAGSLSAGTEPPLGSKDDFFYIFTSFYCICKFTV